MSQDIFRMAENLARTQPRWGLPEVKALVQAAQEGTGITKSGERSLKRVLKVYRDRLEPPALHAFQRFLDKEVAAYRVSPAYPEVKAGLWDARPLGANLDPTAATGKAFITPAGAIVSDAYTEVPDSDSDRADALYSLARLVDDVPGNIFAPPRTDAERRLFGNLFGEAKVDLALKGKVFQYLKDSLRLVPATGARMAKLDDAAALQMRSATVSVLLHLMESLPQSGAGGELKSEALALYKQTLEAETNPVLRDSMVFNLIYIADGFSPDDKQVIDALGERIAPLTPPYGEWFKDGGNTVHISWRAGPGDNAADEFLTRDTDSMIQMHNFRLVIDEPGHRVLEGEILGKQGTLKVILDGRVDNDTMFDNMDDPKTQIVAFGGHSDIGRTIRRGLENAKDQQGAKLVFVDLCSGKDGLFRIRDKYPDAHIVTTFDSSYYGFGEAEGARAFYAILQGIGNRETWETIDGRMQAAVDPLHALDRNYLTPVHTLLRRRLLDSDHDGQADVLDRLVDFSVVKPEVSTEREFTPVKPMHPVNKLDGTLLHTAALTLNTFADYNSTLENLADLAPVVADGYFVPRKGEENTIVRFIDDNDPKLEVQGRERTGSTLRMQVNGNFAHMSEEALRAVACYDLNKYVAEQDPQKYLAEESGWPEGWSDAAKIRVMGLVFAASDLVYDMNDDYWGVHPRDREVWNNLLTYTGAPTIDPTQLFTFLRNIGSEPKGEEKHHDYAGSTRVIDEFLKMLTPEQVAAFKKD